MNFLNLINNMNARKKSSSEDGVNWSMMKFINQGKVKWRVEWREKNEIFIESEQLAHLIKWITKK